LRGDLAQPASNATAGVICKKVLLCTY